MSKVPEQFWMVYGIGQLPPRVKHPTKQSAEDEAERLSRHVPGTVFVVLEAVSAHVLPLPPVERTQYGPTWHKITVEGNGPSTYSSDEFAPF